MKKFMGLVVIAIAFYTTGCITTGFGDYQYDAQGNMTAKTEFNQAIPVIPLTSIDSSFGKLWYQWGQNGGIIEVGSSTEGVDATQFTSLVEAIPVVVDSVNAYKAATTVSEKAVAKANLLGVLCDILNLRKDLGNVDD